MIPADVEAYVLRNFHDADAAHALEILRGAITHTGSPVEPRLMRCATIASRKSLARLKQQVEALAIDYRDVILAAEYIRQSGDYVQIRDLSLPIQDDA